MKEACLKELSQWIARCLRQLSKEKAVISDGLAMFFTGVSDAWIDDKRACLLMFFIFLLEFHALVLTITGATDFDLNGMMKDTVKDRAGRDRIA